MTRAQPSTPQKMMGSPRYTIIEQLNCIHDVRFPVGNPNGGCVRGTDLIICMRSSPLISILSYRVIFVFHYITSPFADRVGSLFTTTSYTHSRSQIYADHHYSCVLSKGGIFTAFPPSGRYDRMTLTRFPGCGGSGPSRKYGWVL